MTAHVRACANCGAGPTSGPAGGACCWNPIGCGCGAVNARFVLPGGESTSATLRRVEQERDELAQQLAAAYEALYIEEFDGDSCPDLETTIEYAIGAYRRVCESEAAAADQIDLLRAELATARAELEQLRAARQWIVARDGGRYCERCEQEIRRGEAYELQPGTGGLLTHVCCPDPAVHINEGEPE